jgi:RNA polymerase sigma factor (sigma-70 family)
MAALGVVQFLREQAVRAELETVTDAQLLQRYIAEHDEVAFAALVRRHAAMVWGVCKRVLRHDQNAEDAFQATFMVMVRKAASIRPQSLLGHWLYGVAHQVAVKARAMNAKRMHREKQLPIPITTESAKLDAWQEWQPLLDKEIGLLPEKYRVIIVLCDLEGRTRKEAAHCLGVPEGTVAGRQARARALLAKRLARHGLAIAGGSLIALLSQAAASAAPASVVSSTIQSANVLAAGGSLAANVAALTEGVVKAMFLSKLKSSVGILLLVFGLGVSAASLSGVFAQTDSDSVEVRKRLEQLLAPDRPIPPKKPADNPKADAAEQSAKAHSPKTPAVPAQADGKLGHIKVEARGRVIAKKNQDGSTPYFLRVEQNKPAPAVEFLLRTKFDKATVIRHVLDLKDVEVILTGNLAWLPKGSRTDSDDDYALGFVIQEKAQMERLDPKDKSPHYLKVEARDDWMIQDNSLVVLVQLQEKPSKRVIVSGPWGSWGLDRLTSGLLKTKQATIAGHATWEPRPDLVILRLHAPQLIDPPLRWKAELNEQKEK